MKKKNLFLNLSKFSSKIAIINNDLQQFTYADLINDVKNFEFFFKEKKLIIILSDNCYEFIACYVAAIKNKQAIILVDKNINTEDLKKLINNYSPDFIFSNSERVIKNFEKKIMFKNYCFSINKKKKFFSITDNLSLLISTSGTTGENKYVKLSEENIYDNTSKISKALNISFKDRAITTMPPFYSYALSILNTHLENGASIILNKYSIIDKKFWNLFNKFKPTNFNGVPYIYEILDKIGLKKLNNNFLNYLTQAGGYLDENLKKKILNYCKARKIKLYIMYGQAEASPRISIMPYKLLEKNLTSVGYPLNGGSIKIINKKFNELKKLYEGEIIYKGKNVFMGYSNNFKDLKKNIKHNYILNTGDIGYIKNKLIYITGRKKRIIKIFGIRISLDQLENELKLKNFNCMCYGNDKKLIVNIKEIASTKKKFLTNLIQKITKLPTQFFEIKFVSKFRRNVSGKILYK